MDDLEVDETQPLGELLQVRQRLGDLVATLGAHLRAHIGAVRQLREDRHGHLENAALFRQARTRKGFQLCVPCSKDHAVSRNELVIC